MDVRATVSTSIRLADEYPPTDDDRPRHELAVLGKVSLDRHPVAVYLARLAPSSRRTMRAALDAIAGLLSDDRCDAWSLDWAQLRYRHTTAVRALLADGRYAPSTANRHLAALRGVLKECWRLGYVSAEEFQRASDLEPVRGSRLPRGRALQPGEVRALFAACEDDDRKKPAMAARDAAILALLYGSGLRRAEAVGLEVADYDREAGTLKVRGKGNKERLAHLGDASQAALEAWLSVRGFASGALFVAINKGGRLIYGRGMSGQAMLYIARRRTVQASVAAFSPHDLRRTFIGDLLDAGADLSTVQQLAGHAQIQTTARYDRRGEATRKRAAKLLHVPYRANHSATSES
jgi:integrase/recombinase XerD